MKGSSVGLRVAWAAVGAVAVVGSSLVAVSPAGTAVAADEVVELPPGEVVASAEEFPGPVERVELADGVVVVQAGGQVLWRSRDDASAEWSSTWGGLPLTGDLVDADGDAVLTQVGVDGPGTLTWASDGGGSREVPAGAQLGRGGYYVLWPTGVVNQWRGEPVTGGSGDVSTPTNPRCVSRTGPNDGFWQRVTAALSCSMTRVSQRFASTSRSALDRPGSTPHASRWAKASSWGSRTGCFRSRPCSGARP